MHVLLFCVFVISFLRSLFFFFFFFNDTATTEIYTLSLHHALPISSTASRGVISSCSRRGAVSRSFGMPSAIHRRRMADRKSTRLNSSHGYISYAVFCLKKKKRITTIYHVTTQHTIAQLRELSHVHD